MFQYFQNNLEIGLFVYKLHIFKSWQLIKVSLKLHVDQKPNLSEGWIQPTSCRLTTSRLFTPKNHITTVHSFETAKALSCCPFSHMERPPLGFSNSGSHNFHFAFIMTSTRISLNNQEVPIFILALSPDTCVDIK